MAKCWSLPHKWQVSVLPSRPMGLPRLADLEPLPELLPLYALYSDSEALLAEDAVAQLSSCSARKERLKRPPLLL